MTKSTKKNQEERITFPSRYSWEKLISRWATVADCGEKKLICAVIASAICDDYERAYSSGRSINDVEDLSFYFKGQFLKHCKWIGVSPEYVIDMIVLANSKVGEKHEMA